jgi:hypothetical protein
MLLYFLRSVSKSRGSHLRDFQIPMFRATDSHFKFQIREFEAGLSADGNRETGVIRLSEDGREFMENILSPTQFFHAECSG